MDLKINRGKYKAMIATILDAYYFLYKGLLICPGFKRQFEVIQNNISPIDDDIKFHCCNLLI